MEAWMPIFCAEYNDKFSMKSSAGALAPGWIKIKWYQSYYMPIFRCFY